MQIIAAIIAVAGAVTAIVSVFKWVTWKMQVTPQEEKEKIDEEIQKRQDAAHSDGRPR